MANPLKNSWWIYLIIIIGGGLFYLTFHYQKAQTDQGVVLNDIFHPLKKVDNTDLHLMDAVTPSNPYFPAKKADPVPAMAIVTSPVNGHEAGFTIQVYSFQDKNRAETALQTLKNNGYQAFLIMSDLGDKGVWYRVRVGGITDEASAHKMLDEIRKTYNSGFILKPQT